MEIQVRRKTLVKGAIILVLIAINLALVYVNFFGTTGEKPEPTPTATTAPAAVKSGKVLDEPVMALARDGEMLWVGTPYGLYRVEGGKVRKVLPQGKENLNVHSLFVHEGKLYLGYTRLQVVKDESGWRFMPGKGKGLAGTAVLEDGELKNLLEWPAWDFTGWQGKLYAALNQGVFDIETGERVGPPTDALGFAVLGDGDYLYAGAFDGIWRWDGENWEHVLDTGELKVTDLARLGDRLYAAVPAGGLYASTDGRTWEKVAEGEFSCIVSSKDALYLCAMNGAYVYAPATGGMDRFAGIDEPVMSIAAGDSLWIGTDRALYLLPGR